ncbi:hypothetical protein HOA69_01780 [Candidatus Woesearchaeota archaeon]|nr:hypothetical protein [Candidatus Woesearchaeota archaeon]MBT6735066.1 hypothetical protein [Candidatus Woesearchaeota archaeon]
MNWSNKVKSLKRKYDRTKKHAVAELLYESGLKSKFLFLKKNDPNQEKISNLINENLNIIERRQIPLYNNIVNYSNILKKVLIREDISSRFSHKIRNLLESYLENGEATLKILNSQKQILQTEYSKENMIMFKESYNDERKLNKNMIKSAKKTKKISNGNYNKIIQASLFVKSIQTSEYIKNNKKTIEYVNLASIATIIICNFSGIDPGDMPAHLRRIAIILSET